MHLGHMTSIRPKAPSTEQLRAKSLSHPSSPPTISIQPKKSNSKLPASKSSLTKGSPTPSPPAAATEPLSLSELVLQARASFASKNYLSAIQLLNRALVLSPDEINLLDTLAACYEKLLKFDTALTHAKGIIQRHVQNPKGYLRAAKILRLQKRYLTACKIYKAGMERSDKESKDYSSLSRLLQELELVMENEARVLDPMVLLPMELILTIFEMVPFEKRCVCTRVSKKWRTTLISVPKFWTELDFTPARPLPAQHSLFMPLDPDPRSNAKVDNLTVLAMAKHFSPKQLVLGTNQNISKGLFSNLIKFRRTKALERLSLQQNYKITDTELSLLWLSTPQLRRLDLYDVYGVSNDVAMALLERCRLLEELDISECRVSPNVFVQSMAKNGPMPTLRKLGLGHVTQRYHHEGIEALVGMFPNLTTLDFRSMCVSDVSALTSLWRLSKMEHLYLDSVDSLSSMSGVRAVSLWMRGMQHLQSFRLRSCKWVSVSAAEMILRPAWIAPLTLNALTPPTVAADPQWQLLPSLETAGWNASLRMLDLSCSPFLELTSLIVEGDQVPVFPNLHTLILNACGSVTEQDVCLLVANTGENLRRFECSRSEAASNQLMYTLRDYCPKIQFVNVSGSSKVTGMGVMALVNHRGQGLEYLCLDGCQNVGADAVDRARYVLGQPSRVSFIFSRK
ncbi:hypothetical protein BGZ73_000844 [Actinomortierella ambigua]|nr:hypothetical protein BGZ73_000844 [Actinomortierella ambigua]